MVKVGQGTFKEMLGWPDTYILGCFGAVQQFTKTKVPPPGGSSSRTVGVCKLQSMGQTGPLPLLESKVLLEQSMLVTLPIVCGCFPAASY